MKNHGEAFGEIGELLGRYFEGLRLADPVRLGDVLHPDALYATAAQGQLVVLGRDAYLAVVAQRTPREGGGEDDDIVAIELAGPETALAKVRCRVGERRFVDFLSLVRVSGRWWVMAKVFHHDGGSIAG